MINLSDVEKFKVKELQNDPVYMGILRKIADRYTLMHMYNPSSADSAEKQFGKFAHRSGLIQGVQIVTEILGYRDDREK